MFEVYLSWTKGIADDPAALKYIKDSGIVAGIELGNLNLDFEKIQDYGLKVSSHTPGMSQTANFTRRDYGEMLLSETGRRMCEVARKADAPVVGFHLGYSAREVFKMAGYPNVSVPGEEIHDREELRKILKANIIKTENAINAEATPNQRKFLLLETSDYSRPMSIPWEFQSEKIRAKKTIIESHVLKSGCNGALRHVTDAAFVQDILSDVQSSCILPVGFLFDVAHNFISYDAKRYYGETQDDCEEYFSKMLDTVRNQTWQIHLNVPGGDDQAGYFDAHLPLDEEFPLTHKMLGLLRQVVRRSPDLKVLTLEIRTQLSPLEHAKKLVVQADYVLHHLGF